jgi:hypothetical protein
MRKWLVRLALATTIIFLAMQIVPYGRDHDNPAVVNDAPWPSGDARSLAVAACYDCHSNETEWPWYANVAPMSWLVQRDVRRGRDELNFSEWPPSGDREADDLADSVEDGEMPPRQYLLNHPEARLSDTEKTTLIAALRALEDGDRGRNRGRGGGDD